MEFVYMCRVKRCVMRGLTGNRHTATAGGTLAYWPIRLGVVGSEDLLPRAVILRRSEKQENGLGAATKITSNTPLDGKEVGFSWAKGD